MEFPHEREEKRRKELEERVLVGLELGYGRGVEAKQTSSVVLAVLRVEEGRRKPGRERGVEFVVFSARYGTGEALGPGTGPGGSLTLLGMNTPPMMEH